MPSAFAGRLPLNPTIVVRAAVVDDDNTEEIEVEYNNHDGIEEDDAPVGRNPILDSQLERLAQGDVRFFKYIFLNKYLFTASQI